MRILRRVLDIVLDAVKGFVDCSGMFLSAGLAFYTLLYCFPLLLLFVSLLGYVLDDSSAALGQVQRIIGSVVPGSERIVADTIEGFVAKRGLLGFLAASGFMLFGTFLFGSIRYVLNEVFEVVDRRSILRGVGADVRAMLGTGGLLALTVGLGSLLVVMFQLASKFPVVVRWLGPGWDVPSRPLSLFFTGTLLYLLYRVAPAKTLGTRGLIAASASGVCLFELSKWAFGFYIETARDYTFFYGALGGLVFFVLWIYYASSVFIFSAFLGRSLERTRDAR